MKSVEDELIQRLLIFILLSPILRKILAGVLLWLTIAQFLDMLWRRFRTEPQRREFERVHPRRYGVLRFFVLAPAAIRPMFLAFLYQVWRGQSKWNDEGRPTIAPVPATASTPPSAPPST